MEVVDGTVSKNVSTSSTPTHSDYDANTLTSVSLTSHLHKEANQLSSGDIKLSNDNGSRTAITPFLPKSKEKKKSISQTAFGPGAKMVMRAEITLQDLQCHLDREGASNLVVELIMSNPNYSIFVESVELGIALLEGGNNAIQKSIYLKLTQGNNSEKFFKVFYDKMKFAQQEIKSTISVSSSDFHKSKCLLYYLIKYTNIFLFDRRVNWR